MTSLPLNITGEVLCKSIGIAYNGTIVKQFRSHGLVEFFKVGKKYMYPSEYIKILSDKLQNKEITIKTDKGYYITLNNIN